MWGALISFGSRYAFFRRWRNVIAFSGAALLCAIAAILVDAKMYLSAGVIGILGLAALALFVAQLFRGRRETRERERRKLAEAVQRAAAAQARAEMMDKAKTSVSDAARTVGSRTADAARTMGSRTADAAGAVSSRAADVTKTGFAAARDSLSSWRSKRNPDGT